MSATTSEDEDLKAAIVMSLADQREASSTEPPPAQPITQDGKTSNNAATSHHLKTASTLSFAGLDRKAMEEERLARLARKRERSISPPPLGPRKAQKVEETTVPLPSGAMLRSFSTSVNQDQLKRKSPAANAANQALKAPPSNPPAIKQEPLAHPHIDTKPQLHITLKYPTGIVKKTWAYGFPRTNKDIKLEEVLEPQTLRTAVLSAFQWDMEWILAKLKTPQNGGSTKCVFVMQAETDELRTQMLNDTAEVRSWLRLCFPPMYKPINCMHSKLMLLFHADKLRVAVPTANLLSFDWGETGVMENSVFMIDLPRLKPDAGKVEVEEMTAFARELLHFLERQGIDQDIRQGVLNFDFSATQGMAFVHSVGGSNFRDGLERTGLPGLARAVRELGLETGDGLQIDFAASSIGSLNDEYLKTVHATARGEDMIARAKAALSKGKAKADFFKSTSSAAAKSPAEQNDIRDKFRIYFPTHDTVRASIAQAAGSICLNQDYFEKATFPRPCFRDYRSTRAGLLSHNKILYARGHQAVGEKGKGSRKDVAWAYVGSANMSESAWGKICQDSKDKAWKIICRNWECGVLLPVPADTMTKRTTIKPVMKKQKIEGEDSETESEDEGGGADGKRVVDISVFNNILEPPFEIPGAKYEGKKPWYFKRPIDGLS